ncbi:MAG TPA: efflux RND transporter periplasmic adaptor subunit [Vicinamibacterales bacterium]|jgi:membrane fusion protein, multidrug efflux system|nr:efflux RND transporter periplasmic adaptor subunit [Vicinamibacterales bacterium]
MVKRMILMLSVMAAIIAGLGFVKFKQIQTAMAEGAAFQPPPEAVTTIVAAMDEWPSTQSAIGTTAPVQGVTVSADLPGIVDRIRFESGRAVQDGEVLVELDTRQERAQLAAAEAQRDLAQLNFKRMENLVEDGAIARADYDRAAAEQKSTEARVGEIRATIERKVIHAPFSGVLGIRQVHLGQYLSAGDPVVSLQALDPIYVNFGVPQQEAGQLKAGRRVRLTADNLDNVVLTGRVTALDSVVDETTRNVRVQATFANPNGKLRPGMFVQVEATAGASQSIIALPASAISYAPYGDSVFVVSDMKDPAGKPYRGVRQQFVKLGATRGDQIAVVSGVKAGEEIVTSGVFKLRNGAAVQVNNKVKPTNNKAPKPEDS